MLHGLQAADAHDDRSVAEPELVRKPFPLVRLRQVYRAYHAPVADAGQPVLACAVAQREVAVDGGTEHD